MINFKYLTGKEKITQPIGAGVPVQEYKSRKNLRPKFHNHSCFKLANV